MHPQQDNTHTSPQPLQPVSSSVDPAPSRYLQIPEVGHTRRPSSLHRSRSSHRPLKGRLEVPQERSTSELLPIILGVSPRTEPESPPSTRGSPAQPSSLRNRIYMSVYSASSIESNLSEFSNPPARSYRLPNSHKMPRKISVAEKEQYIQALRTHQVNTVVELRRIEKAFAVLGTPDVSEPMTAAWSYYVDSHSLLTELRGLTRNYPFSSHCLDEAKRRVYADPASNRSWNLCWLVLSKIQTDQLIPYYARYQASQPTMWGGHNPSSEQIAQLTNAFVAEWSYALSQILRHWDQPPAR